jgi:hypothetical protein
MFSNELGEVAGDGLKMLQVTNHFGCDLRDMLFAQLLHNNVDVS